MATRTKRPGNTVTLSVSVSREDAAILRKRAKRLYGGNVSAVIGDAAELLRIEEGRQALDAQLEAELGPLDPEVEQKIHQETLGLIPPVRRKKRRKAA